MRVFLLTKNAENACKIKAFKGNWVKIKNGQKQTLKLCRSKKTIGMFPTATPTNNGAPSPGGANPSAYSLSNKVYDIYTIPTTLTFTSKSNNATGAGTVTQYIFNNSFFNAAVTTNGSAAASIVNTYGDGWTGKGYEQLFGSVNQAAGLFIKGFTVQAVNHTSGAQLSTPYNTLNFQVLNANLQGTMTPVPFDVQSAVNNMQQQIGILTIRQGFRINALSQLSYSHPENTDFAWTFFTQASSF